MNERTGDSRVDRIPFDDSEVFRLTIPQTDLLTIEHAKEIAAATSVYAPGRRALFLVDARRAGRMTQEARQYLASDEATKNILAMAILVGSPVSRIVGNFFLMINKPRVPANLFSSEKDALSWLKGFAR